MSSGPNQSTAVKPKDKNNLVNQNCCSHVALVPITCKSAASAASMLSAADVELMVMTCDVSCF